MKTLRVNIPGREYDIVCERGAIDRVGELVKPILKGNLVAIITDSNVEKLYATRVARSLHLAGYKAALLEIPPGEESKTPEVLMEVWEQLMDVGLTRSDAIIALGGGVVGDLAGFAAATILRGVDFVQVPTTLLAQVDSSVGGKVAVDLQAGKNLAGAFYQPKMVIMDPEVLKTLPDRVFSDGMAEVIKYGCIWDAQLLQVFDILGSRENIMNHIEDVVLSCCDIKRQVVEEDEKDTGKRMLLNFGHTLGHVYEKAYDYRGYTHGEAIAAGMVAAAKLGEDLGVTPKGVSEEIAAVLKKYHLPTAIKATPAQYAETLGKDKKSQGKDINLVVLTALGHAETVKLPVAGLLQRIGEVLG